MTLAAAISVDRPKIMAEAEEVSTTSSIIKYHKELVQVIREATEFFALHFPPDVVEALSEFIFYERRKTEEERHCSSNFFIAQRARLKRKGVEFDAIKAAELVVVEIIEPWAAANHTSLKSWSENGFINLTSPLTQSKSDDAIEDEDLYEIEPIGIIETVFGEKHGTPRQGILAPDVRGIIRLRRELGPLALQNVDEFSHMWVMWMFDQNTNVNYKPLVRPPRLRGGKTGVFATRSPHRPNPIGLSLVKIVRVHKTTITVSGVDLVNGTSVVDLKPYIPLDYCQASQFPEWIESPQVLLEVRVSERAQAAIERVVGRGMLRFYDRSETENVVRAIKQTIGLDPRSTHSKAKHQGGIYGIKFDRLDVVFRIIDDNIAMVEMVKFWKDSEHRPKLNCAEWLSEITKELESSS